MATSVYMPLRSNAAWFSTHETRLRLERQLKMNLVLYDHVFLQDGIYRLSVGQDGQGMEFLVPPKATNSDRTTVSYYSEGAPFGVSVGGKTVMHSTTHVAYDVDFYPIINSARLNDLSCLRWLNGDLVPQLKHSVSQQADKDLRTGEYDEVLPQNSYLRRRILESLYIDSIMARELRMPMSIDDAASSIVLLTQRQAAATWTPEVPASFYRYWMNLTLPDITALSWPELCEFRESDKGKSFRDMIHRVSGRVKEQLPNLRDQRDVDSIVANEFNSELIRELAARLVTPGKAIASTVLNILPFSLFTGIATTASAYEADSSSWVSLLRVSSPATAVAKS